VTLRDPNLLMTLRDPNLLMLPCLSLQVNLACKVLNAIVGPVIRKARGEEIGLQGSLIRFPWGPQPEEGSDEIVEGLEDAVKGAFVISLSRAFAVPSTTEGIEEEDRLEPLLDMLQHSNEPNIRHKCGDDGTIEVVARNKIVQGEELFNQYRGENDLPYHKFFTRFGFVPGVSEPIANLVAERSPIFFPQRAEV